MGERSRDVPPAPMSAVSSPESGSGRAAMASPIKTRPCMMSPGAPARALADLQIMRDLRNAAARPRASRGPCDETRRAAPSSHSAPRCQAPESRCSGSTGPGANQSLYQSQGDSPWPQANPYGARDTQKEFFRTVVRC